MSTSSSSTIPIRPTPAAARYARTGDPSPPAPTHKMRAAASRSTPAKPTSGINRWRAYRRRSRRRAIVVTRPELPSRPQIQVTVADDARGAVDGRRDKDYGFHTDLETAPWGMVDCQHEFRLTEIRLYNRKGPPVLQRRLGGFRIEVSRDSTNWAVLASSRETFGLAPGEMEPFAVTSADNRAVRYVRVVAEEKTFLHLAQVEVYGVPV